MADTVNIGGKKIPQWVVWGGAGVAVVAGVLYYKNKQNASSTANSSAIDPVTGLPYSEDSTVDPLTGMTYLAEAQQYGSVAAAESAVSSGSSTLGSGYSGSGYSSSGLAYGNPTSNVTSPTGTTFTSNAQWGQSAIAALEQLGYSSSDASTAIGVYLAGMTLTTTQAQLVQVAIGELGEPPSPLPVNITQAGSNSGGSGSTGSTGSTGGSSGGTTGVVNVPDCAGQTTGQAHNTIVAAGLKPVAPAGQTDALICTGTNPPAGTQLSIGSSVEIEASGVTVPNCVGMTAGNAHNTIVNAGLHPTAPAGQKAAQICKSTNPAAGKIVSPGSSVEILT